MNDDWLNWKILMLLDKGFSFYKILMKLFYVDFIFILEIEGEGLLVKLKNFGILIICLILLIFKSFIEIKKIEILFIIV